MRHACCALNGCARDEPLKLDAVRDALGILPPTVGAPDEDELEAPVADDDDAADAADDVEVATSFFRFTSCTARERSLV
jgi:hypothetical protein